MATSFLNDRSREISLDVSCNIKFLKFSCQTHMHDRFCLKPISSVSIVFSRLRVGGRPELKEKKSAVF